MDEKKSILKGECYGCFWRGPARALQIQRKVLMAIIGLSTWSLMEELEGRLEELKGFAAL